MKRVTVHHIASYVVILVILGHGLGTSRYSNQSIRLGILGIFGITLSPSTIQNWELLELAVVH